LCYGAPPSRLGCSNCGASADSTWIRDLCLRNQSDSKGYSPGCIRLESRRFVIATGRSSRCTTQALDSGEMVLSAGSLLRYTTHGCIDSSWSLLRDFRASVRTSGGIVDLIHVELRRDTRAFPTSDSAGITSEYLTYPAEIRRLGSESYWFPTPVGKPYLWVALTAKADNVQRQHAYAYSLTCLVKPGRGCDLPCDYLPLAWRDWESDLNERGFGFDGHYSARARCP
jgi:hypothetical protein